MFARRTAWNTEPNALALRIAALRRQGAPFVDLTETNPTRVGLDVHGAATLEALASERALRYEPDARGLEAARQAVCDWYAADGIAVDEARVLLASGTSELYSHIFRLLLNPGESVLVPSPSYPLLDFLADLNDVRLIPYPLEYDGRWWIDTAALEAVCAADTRAVVLISPNNPTGSYVKRRERDELAAFAAARGIALIADEVFIDYAYGPDPERAGSLAAGAGDALVFALGGLSKALALPQMKLAWAVAGGAAGPEAMRRLEIIADTYLSIGTPVQWAFTDWARGRSRVQGPIRERVKSNFETLRGGRAFDVLAVEGGWSAVLRVRGTMNDEARVLDLLDRGGVLVDPGSFFGFRRAGYLVVSLLPEPAVFAEGVARLDARLKEEGA